MQDLEDRLRELGNRASLQVPSELRPTPRALRRIRVGRALRSGALLATVAALVIGGFAGARSLTSDEALPPAEEDSNVSPFVDTWTSTDVDGRTRTMVIRASSEDVYEITVRNHLALVCSGAPSTLTGIGRLVGSKLVIASPEITCDDGSEPKVADDLPPPEELLGVLEFEHDPESDILTNYSPLELRRLGRNDQAIYSGVTLVWSRADAENPIGDVSGWITYGDKRGIWARDLASPGDPSDRVLLSPTSGSPIAWSPDGSKLLVGRDNEGLFVVNSDGTETRLTDANSSIDGSSLSPDGTAVVYAATPECWWSSSCGAEGGNVSSAIYVVDAEGGTPQILLAAGSRRYPDRPGPGGPGRFETALQEPKWSPDGSQIAYFDGMVDWGHSLRVMNSDGTGVRVVVENSMTLAAGHVFGLAWSPDGEHLVFAIDDGSYSGEGWLDKDGGAYVVRVDGSGLRHVATHGLDPFWSPDGSHIAYTRPDPQSEGGSLEIVRLGDLRVQNFGDGGSGPWTSELRW